MGKRATTNEKILELLGSDAIPDTVGNSTGTVVVLDLLEDGIATGGIFLFIEKPTSRQYNRRVRISFSLSTL